MLNILCLSFGCGKGHDKVTKNPQLTDDDRKGRIDCPCCREVIQDESDRKPRHVLEQILREGKEKGLLCETHRRFGLNTAALAQSPPRDNKMDMTGVAAVLAEAAPKTPSSKSNIESTTTTRRSSAKPSAVSDDEEYEDIPLGVEEASTKVNDDEEDSDEDWDHIQRGEAFYLGKGDWHMVKDEGSNMA
ncbi:uncharacterized protein AB675_3686 [Cyphellophora attinorum]|uniref:Uncharacterized protein n=1 Tax=Cyphellophora attinorum TaxID=1664694 RepID=A0A0N1NYJ4_9EURO|nr:uncharacterized protein AB675_3686 [Phialophora attinorum]KPI37096.1 hypothetical protein AB675_3686 [Phialophora attinorum]